MQRRPPVGPRRARSAGLQGCVSGGRWGGGEVVFVDGEDEEDVVFEGRQKEARQAWLS